MQRAVGRLPPKERRRFATWLLTEYPPRTVSGLLSRAEKAARAGKWTPQPPTEDNIPKGAALERAVRRAKALGLRG